MKAKAVFLSTTFCATSFHLLLFLICAFNASAQTGSGVINFGNPNAPYDRRIWTGPDNGPLVRVAGTSYKIALYWGRQGTPEAGLTQVGAAATFFTGTAAGTF